MWLLHSSKISCYIVTERAEILKQKASFNNVSLYVLFTLLTGIRLFPTVCSHVPLQLTGTSDTCITLLTSKCFPPTVCPHMCFQLILESVKLYPHYWKVSVFPHCLSWSVSSCFWISETPFIFITLAHLVKLSPAF